MEEDFSKYPNNHKDAKRIGEQYYYTGKPCKRNHSSVRYASTRQCVECFQSDHYKEYDQKYKEENREWINAKRRQRYSENPEYGREYSRWFHKENPEYKRNWEKENDKHVKEWRSCYRKNKYAQDPVFKSTVLCRTSLRRVFIALGEDKTEKTFDVLGYSAGDMKEHIERNFLQGMCWGNYGDWHIDHIIPISRCIKMGITDPAKVNCFTNLMPMWSHHNQSKNDSLLSEYLNDNPRLYSLYKDYLQNEAILKEMADGRT